MRILGVYNLFGSSISPFLLLLSQFTHGFNALYSLENDVNEYRSVHVQYPINSISVTLFSIIQTQSFALAAFSSILPHIFCQGCYRTTANNVIFRGYDQSGTCSMWFLLLFVVSFLFECVCAPLCFSIILIIDVSFRFCVSHGNGEKLANILAF